MFLSFCLVIEVYRASSKGSSRLYDQRDFDTELFPAGWDVVYDRLGDGCHVEYPVTLRPVLKYGKKCFCINSDGGVSEKPRIFYETVSDILVKKRC